MQLWQKQKGTGMARWRRKSPAMLLLALLLSFAQVQFALAAIVNEVTANGTFDGNVYTATATESVAVEPAAPSLNVQKIGILNDDVLPTGISAGDTISYEITAENNGNTTLTNVVANDPLLPGAALVFDLASDVDSDGELDVGETWRWTGSYALDQVIDIDTAGGGDNDVDNTVTIIADELALPVTASDEVPLVPTAELTLTKNGVYNDTVLPAGQNAGDTVDYTVLVRNTGNVTINVTGVNDPLVALTWDGIDLGSDGVLSPGEIWTYEGTYILQQSDFDTNGGGDGTLDNIVTVSTDELPDQDATHALPLDSESSMTIDKTADISAVNVPGDLITYTVTATNTGNTALTNVTVNNPMLTLDTEICPVLAPSATCVLTGTYPVSGPDISAGTVQNTAGVTSDEGINETVILDTPLVATPNIALAKSVAPTFVTTAGTPVAYTVIVSNTGNVPLTGVVVSDPLLALDCGAGSSTIATLNPGSPVTCTGTYPIDQGDIDAGPTLINTATVNDDGTYGVTANDTATVTFAQTPSMTVVKSGVLNDDDGVPGVSENDTIAYSVIVTNTGNLSLTNIVPNDPLVTLAYFDGDLDLDNEIDPGEVWEFTGSYPLTQIDVDSLGGGDGNIENTVAIESDQLPNQIGNTDVPLNINPSMEVVKTGVLNDDDGDAGLTEGDTVTYSVVVTNTGNVRLTNVVASDPLVTLTLVSGDLNSDNRLDTNEIWTFTGTTIITQVDLDTLGGGDGDIDNTVTISTDQLPDQDASHELPLAPVSSITIEKVATTPVRLFPTVYEFDYELTITNTGAVTQTNIRVEDDIAAAIAPATLLNNPLVTVSGFSGTGGLDGAYNGVSNIDILTGDVQLAPGASGQIVTTLRIDTGGQSTNGLNTAFVDSDQVSTPIASNDPTLTPGDPSDVNPTPIDLPDTDGDGSPDADEDVTADRDGDGSANSDDYDPTGYFYCQADGRILSGGRIRLDNLTSGGSQTGIGSSNGIVILRDGNDGRYQFYVTQEGTFRLAFETLPTDGILSTTLLDSGTLDVSTPPDNPRVIGSGEFGSTGILDDFTEATNPYYTLFEFEQGDPAVFNNNIPMQFCGSPLLAADKSVESGPDLQPDLSYDVTYRMTMSSTGNEYVENVQMVDDLDAVFGAGNYSITSRVLDSAPVDFTGAIDPFFDGSGNTALLTSGSTLQPGESVTVLLSVNVNVASGVFSNVLSVNGTTPFDGSPVPPASDDADINITAPSDLLLVEKTALPGSAPLGAPVAYTIKVTNIGPADFLAVDIVDLIPNGMTYITDSARVDGVAQEPIIDPAKASGRELVWNPINIATGGSVTITLTLVINASAGAQEFINNAYVRNPITGERISNIAKAEVRLEIEPVFQCSDIIGRVFDDFDKDGYADDGEPGLPGVRLATPRGLLITTDKFGRYSIACGAIPDEDIGSNFILKLDTRTLPTGYRVTSENPRVVRLTRGKLTKLNFAAANLRIVRLELSDASFKPGTTILNQETLNTLGGLLLLLDEEPSVLRIIYQGNGGLNETGQSRLQTIEDLISRAWSQLERSNELKIETKLFN